MRKQQKRKQTVKHTYKKTKAAEAEAEANKKVAESVTDELIRYTEAQARQKHGWITTNGANTVVKEGN